MSTMGYVTTLTGAEDAANLSLNFEKQIYKIVQDGKQVEQKLSDVLAMVRVSRAGRFNDKGKYEILEPNQPRIDYDPLTKLVKGLLIERTTTNQTTYSDTFTSSSWVKSSGFVELVGSSPFGKCYKYRASTAAAPHFLQKTYSSLPVGTYCSTRVIKAGEHTKVRAQLFGTQAHAAADFDLAAGTVASSSGLAQITPIGDGWFIASITGTTTAVDSITDRWYPVKGVETSFAGNASDGYYVAASQFESNVCPTSIIPSTDTFSSRSSTATYFDSRGVLRVAGINVPRSSAYIYNQDDELVPVGLLLESAAATNRLKLSSDFDSAPWNKNGTTITVMNGGAAPDGSMAQRFRLNGTTGHNIQQPLDSALLTTSSYTLSIWLRAIKWTNAAFQMAYYDAGNQVNQLSVYPTTEWKRHTFTFVPLTTAAAPQVRFIGYSQGNNGDTIEMWGAQLEVGDTATSYIPTSGNFTSRASTATYIDSSGVLQVADVNVGRSQAFQYAADGKVRPIGTLFENSATNLLGYSQEFDKGWGNNGPASTTPLVVTPNAVSGTRGPNTMALLRRADTTVRYLTKSFTGGAAGSTITRTQRVKAGTTPSSWLSVRIQCDYPNRVDAWFDTATGECGGNAMGDTSIGNVSMYQEGDGVWVCILTATCTSKPWSATLMTPQDRAAAVDAGTTAVSEVYVDTVQIELGAKATSYIPTLTDSAATRAADAYTSYQATRAADISNSSQTTRVADYAYNTTLSRWFNQAQGTASVVGQHRVGSSVPNKHIFNFQGTAVQDWMALRNAMGILQVGSGNTDGSATMIMGGTTVPDGVTFMSSLRYKNNDAALSINGAAVQKDTTCLFPAVKPYTRLVLGSYNQGNENMNGWLKSFNYYRDPLSDSQLQIISA